MLSVIMLSIIMPRVIVLSIIMQSVIVLIIIMLSIIMLSIIMQSVDNTLWLLFLRVLLIPLSILYPLGRQHNEHLSIFLYIHRYLSVYLDA
jgi:hypothetical protein